MARFSVKWLLIGLVGITVVGALVVVFAGPPAIRMVKSMRADTLLRQSIEASEAGDHRTAFERASAANNMRPGDPEIIMQAARTTLDFAHMTMGFWWGEVARLERIDVDPTLTYVDLLLGRNLLDEAEVFVERLRFQEPDHAGVAERRIRLYRLQRRFAEGRFYGDQLMARGIRTPGVRAELIATHFATTGPEGRLRGQALLDEDDTFEEPLSAAAFRGFLASGDFPAGLRTRLANRLLDHPEATRFDRFFAYGVLYDIGEFEWERIEADAREQFDLSDPADRLEWIGFLIGVRRFSEAVDVAEAYDVEETGALLEQYIEALVLSGSPVYLDRALRITFRPIDTLPLDMTDVFLWRAIIQRNLGQIEESLRTINSAIDVAEAAEVQRLENYLLQIGEWPSLIRLYERLAENPRTREFAQRRLLTAYYHLGDEEAVLRLLGTLTPVADAGGPSFENFVAYLNAIYGREVRTSQQTMERLVAQFPGVVDFRVTLSLLYGMGGQGRMAREIVQGVPSLPRGTPRHVIVAAVPIFQAKGDREEAERLRQLLVGERLLPRERQIIDRPLGGS